MGHMNNAPRISFGNRVRKSPYFSATRRAGVQSFNVYNHMYMPTGYFSPEEEFENLISGVTLWDVACQRQVEVIGPDASAFTQYLTPRNLNEMKPGQCKYVPICDEHGNVLNDPILLKLAEDRFWFSLADSDILLWAKALAYAKGFDVTVTEPDVSPVQIQGPKSLDVVERLFGDWIKDLKYYWFRKVTLDGVPLVVSRTGWSSERGYEIYLCDGRYGDWLWDKIMETGCAFGIKPGVPNSIRRIEGAMYSAGADFRLDANPFELGLARLVDLQMQTDYVGKQALLAISREGISRRMIGLCWNAPRLSGPNEEWWPVYSGGNNIGELRSAVFSPRLGLNIALAMLSAEVSIGDTVSVAGPDGPFDAEIHPIPFYDPRKRTAAK